MTPMIHLWVHNILACISGLTAMVLAIFVFWKNPRKKANIVMTMANVSVAVFIISHLIGTNITDGHLSKLVLMCNISIIFIVIFTMHITLIILKIDQRRQWFIFAVYVIGILLAAIYIIFPNTFLLDSVPKMYFPNYYVPGNLQWIMRLVFDAVIPIYLLSESIAVYVHTNDPIEQNRIKLWVATVSLGYVVGSIPIFLVYNIHVDPALGIWAVPLYMVPLVYAIVNYELVDVKIIAKKAFLYSITIAVVGVIISFFNLSNQIVLDTYPLFPFWGIPFISSVIAVSIGVAVWRRLRQGDLLKYEFITTVTHKFRTPLTHIKWASENLAATDLPSDTKEQISYIQDANTKLVNLTNLLVDVSESENSTYEYTMERNNLSAIVLGVITDTTKQLEQKKIILTTDIQPDLYILGDASRLSFVIQALIENATEYSSRGGSMSISTIRQGKNIIFSVHDNGIGISKEELPLIFSKFYRGKVARSSDTEGMGIGLYISKGIITKHKGKIWAESDGPNKGSTFSFSVPMVG